jgi:hypothetical protein
VNPTFFNSKRLDAIREVFETMDADEELTLDLNEMTPFYHFVFDFVFHVTLYCFNTHTLSFTLSFSLSQTLMFSTPPSPPPQTLICFFIVKFATLTD